MILTVQTCLPGCMWLSSQWVNGFLKQEEPELGLNKARWGTQEAFQDFIRFSLGEGRLRAQQAGTV